VKKVALKYDDTLDVSASKVEDYYTYAMARNSWPLEINFKAYGSTLVKNKVQFVIKEGKWVTLGDYTKMSFVRLKENSALLTGAEIKLLAGPVA